MFNPNPAFLLVQKLKSAPKGFYPRSKGLNSKKKKKKKLFQSAPSTNKMLNFMAFYWAPKAGKKDNIKFWRPIDNPWGQCSSIY
jgi:hypothetical protein